MLNKVLIFILYLVTVSVLSDSKPPSKQYNHYNDNIKLLNAYFDLGIGVSKFLDQSQRFLNQEIPNTTPQSGAVYDFVIIGAGTAGATVAARLSEIRQAQVLLIEAGSHENFFMDIPLLTNFMQLNDAVNWKYRTKSSNSYCLGYNDKSCNWPRGKVVGGSSVLNYMIATRGAAEDYDQWAKMGNKGWAYKDVLKYFKKMEKMDIPELMSDTTYHETKGPLHISYPSFQTPLAEAFLKAGVEQKYPLVDYNGKNMIGFSYVQATIENGTRASSNRAYLHPIRARKNFHLTYESMVRKVLIDHRTNRAIGVEFSKYGRNISVFATKEVILCAGAIGSPQLLMLSGIGPVKHLIELGIHVIRDAAVGENLMDHVTYYGLSWSVDVPVSLRIIDVINPVTTYLKKYLMNQPGPLNIPGAAEALAFINTKFPEKRSGLPDIELLFFGGMLHADFFNKIALGLNIQLLQRWQKYNNMHGWTLLTVLLKPKSRGRIRLLANDVNVKPEIVPNYFVDPEDMETIIAGIRAALNIGQTEAMQAFGSRLLNNTVPECESYEYNSDAYWECQVRTLATTLFHFSGTCKMGPKTDPAAVVDPTLKVIGIQGLRVADASIMPDIISAHTNIPVFMIAEKVTDMIKEEWGYLEK